MNIEIYVLLLLENGIVSGNKEQESNANQPDRPSKGIEEPSHMVVEIDSFLESPDEDLKKMLKECAESPPYIEDEIQ